MEEDEREERRAVDVRKKEQLKKNVYLFHPLPPKVVEKEETEKDSIGDLEVVEFEYRTDDYDPLSLASK